LFSLKDFNLWCPPLELQVSGNIRFAALQLNEAATKSLEDVQHCALQITAGNIS